MSVPGRPLAGEVAIVTGASRGVGRAVAEGLASAGASVALAARTQEALQDVAAEIERLDGLAEVVVTDVTDPVAVERLVARTEQTLGPPALLVANAGSWRQVGPLWEAKPEDWWQDVEVTLRGAFLCARAVLPPMLERRRGRIVTVSSYAAIRPGPWASAYATAKAGLLRMTDSLAAELDGTGVLAFAIAPGFARTDLVESVAGSAAGRRYLPALGEREDIVPPERTARLVARIASGELDDLAGRFLHALDDVDELRSRAEELRRDDLYVLRLRR